MPAKEVIDLRGHLLLPGLVDSHVHFNQPGREEWEGYTPGTRAAAAGGVTTILEMPFNATPPTSTPELLQAKRDAVENKSVVDYRHWGGLDPDNLDQLHALHEAGAAA